jgi:formylmethanofuran dehydrogenase subunit E
MFDKYTGEGVRVHVDMAQLAAWPELRAWFLKEKPKAAQDAEQLLREIESAGDTVCAVAPIRIRKRLLGHSHMGSIGVCPVCGEAFPQNDGVICRGCQGEAPYVPLGKAGTDELPHFAVLSVQDAVGKTALHDMTRLVPGKSKGAEFKAGQVITAGDVCRLQHMGRFALAVCEGSEAGNFVHENEGALAFACRMAGENVIADAEPREGKIGFTAKIRGLFSLDAQRLAAFNLPGDVICAARHDATLVDEGGSLAATRVIPLYLEKSRFAEALSLLHKPLFAVLPLRRARVGILVTGTEVFTGLVEDGFIPVITAKVEAFSCTVVESVIVPDDKQRIHEAVERIRNAGADLLVTTGGLSVDPEDVTHAALTEAGLRDVLYGAPVLPGSMTLVGRMAARGSSPAQDRAVNGLPEFDLVTQPCPGEMQVIGVPACALYFKTTLLDALLPRLLAGRRITRPELAAMGEGGICANCKVCTWPKCFFLK